MTIKSDNDCTLLYQNMNSIKTISKDLLSINNDYSPLSFIENIVFYINFNSTSRHTFNNVNYENNYGFNYYTAILS